MMVKVKHSASDRQSGDPRVLLVDDDRLVLATLGEGLQTGGYSVLTADSGEEALAICDAQAPDIAVLDWRMPSMSGLQLAARLAERDIPFMFLTANNDEEAAARAIREGALAYLVKPVDVAQLLPALAAARHLAVDLAALRETSAQLKTALEGRREISMAVGLLMERHGLDQEAAFELLRGQARRERRKLVELATAVLDGAGIHLPESPGDTHQT